MNPHIKPPEPPLDPPENPDDCIHSWHVLSQKVAKDGTCFTKVKCIYCNEIKQVES